MHPQIQLHTRRRAKGRGRKQDKLFNGRGKDVDRWERGRGARWWNWTRRGSGQEQGRRRVPVMKEGTVIGSERSNGRRKIDISKGERAAINIIEGN